MALWAKLAGRRRVNTKRYEKVLPKRWCPRAVWSYCSGLSPLPRHLSSTLTIIPHGLFPSPHCWGWYRVGITASAIDDNDVTTEHEPDAVLNNSRVGTNFIHILQMKDGDQERLRLLEKELATHSSTTVWINPPERGAWRATVHRAAKSDTTERLTRPRKAEKHVHSHTAWSVSIRPIKHRPLATRKRCMFPKQQALQAGAAQSRPPRTQAAAQGSFLLLFFRTEPAPSRQAAYQRGDGYKFPYQGPSSAT